MSAKLKLTSKLPGNEDINGLDAKVDEFLATPEKVRLVLGWVDVKEVHDVTATGDRIPVLQWRRLELVGEADNAPPELKELALRLYEERTGKAPLPINLTEPISSGPVD